MDMKRMSPDELTEDLRQSCRDFLQSLEGLSNEDIFKRPAPSEWSAWEVCYHVATGEMWFIAKLCEAAYPDKPAAAQRLMAAWATLRQEALELAREVPPDRWHQTGILTGVPDWTPAKLLARHAGHDREHARQTLEARGLPVDPAEKENF